MTGSGTGTGIGGPRIGWYVHHHGAGHLTRFLAVRAALIAEVIVFSSLAAPSPLPPHTEWVRLERDDLPEARVNGSVLSPALCEPDATGLLHWAPLGHRGHAHRLARIAAELAARPCGAFVVDVSVEVTLLVRLLGVPVVLFAQPGERRDAPHTLAYRLAAHIIAPWPEGAHAPIAAGTLVAADTAGDLVAADTTGAPVVASTAPAAASSTATPVSYVGGISRYAGRTRTSTLPGTVFVLGSQAAFVLGSQAAFVLGSQAGDSTDHLRAAQQATPNFRWLTPLWAADPWPALCAAEIVVSWAGQNSVADLAAAGVHAVVIAQPRPFAEQDATATALDHAGLAVGVSGWPEPLHWPELLERARALTPEWSRWQIDGAAERAAQIILGVAG